MFLTVYNLAVKSVKMYKMICVAIIIFSKMFGVLSQILYF